MQKQRDADNQIIRKCGEHLMTCMSSWHARTLKPSMPALNLSAPCFQKGSTPSSNLSNIRTAEILAELGDATDRSGDIVRPVDDVQSKESMMMKGVCRKVDTVTTAHSSYRAGALWRVVPWSQELPYPNRRRCGLLLLLHNNSSPGRRAIKTAHSLAEKRAAA